MDGGISNTLETACVDTNSMSGLYFDLQASDSGPIEITGFSVYSQHCADTPGGAAIYYTEGPSSGHELDSCAWALAGSVTTFSTPGCGGCCSRAGDGCTTDMDVMLPQLSAYELPVPLCITVPAGARYGLYLAITSGSATFETTTLPAGSEEVTSNADVKVYVGHGHDYQDGYGAFAPAASGLKDRQAFQGVLHYRHP
jgi:hypothetical protein